MNKKYYRFVMTFFICAPFSALMTLIGIVRNLGLMPETFSRWLTTWVAMLPIAYIAALIIVPAAKVLTDKLPWQTKEGMK
jgi:ABC-type multidrug transport system permease subunit